uniref:Uncharacterized protein n=1 Tax=Meloidogyne enterolobii TaxID=390850 RepID=A0A6V7V2W3_MELEN|nr:unnamed protein product [Meloidogyne enterolobii]
MLELTQYLLIIVDSCPSQKENNNLINNNSKIETHTKLIRQISKFTSITTKNDEENNEIVNLTKNNLSMPTINNNIYSKPPQIL